MNKLESRTWFATTILFMLAFFAAIYFKDVAESRVKELETENEMLREKIKETKFPKPSIRMYKPKCNCSCGK